MAKSAYFKTIKQSFQNQIIHLQYSEPKTKTLFLKKTHIKTHSIFCCGGLYAAHHEKFKKLKHFKTIVYKGFDEGLSG